MDYGVSPDDARYYKQYEIGKAQILANAECQAKGLALPHEPKHLDMRVRMIFDEDLNTLNFPRVKELSFKVNSDMPFEVAAKALASRNGHPELWRYYSFSIILKDKSGVQQNSSDADDQQPNSIEKEIVITDLRKCFISFKKDCWSDHRQEQELTFFYKINCEHKSPFVVPKSTALAESESSTAEDAQMQSQDVN